MRLKRIVSIIAAGCAAVVLSAASGVAGQTPHEHGKAADKVTPTSDMATMCDGMMAERQKMMAEMKAADQRLDDLVAKMNAASGAEKADATAAVVAELVTQRRTMRGRMMEMHQGMMRHMMAHMQAGKESMANCPMMKEMGGVRP